MSTFYILSGASRGILSNHENAFHFASTCRAAVMATCLTSFVRYRLACSWWSEVPTSVLPWMHLKSYAMSIWLPWVGGRPQRTLCDTRLQPKLYVLDLLGSDRQLAKLLTLLSYFHRLAGRDLNWDHMGSLSKFMTKVTLKYLEARLSVPFFGNQIMVTLLFGHIYACMFLCMRCGMLLTKRFRNS